MIKRKYKKSHVVFDKIFNLAIYFTIWTIEFLNDDNKFNKLHL